MAQRIGVGILVGIAALLAGMGCITLFFTGGLGDDGRVHMVALFFLIAPPSAKNLIQPVLPGRLCRGIFFSADGAGAILVVVSQRSGFTGFGFTADRADFITGIAVATK